MKAQDYHSTITANISTKEAIDAISDVPAWWATNFEGHSKKMGDVFTIRFGETSVTFTLTEVVAGKKIVWLVTDCYLHWLKDKKEWNGTKVVWNISRKNNATQIDMTHEGLVQGIECYDNCEAGWNHFTKKSLFKLLTEHKGLPEGAGTVRQR